MVAGDDRAARDLAADLRAFLAPRPVRFYPARGMRYESHLAPPPHLVGLRIAALDALLDDGEQPAVAGRRAPRRSPRRCPTPSCARTASRSTRASCSTSTRSPTGSSRCGYERVDQVEERGQFAVRGDILDVYPATEERAVRCELFDVEVERLTWFSTFTQRSLEEAERVEIAPAAELGPEHRELAEIAAATEADERPDIADVLPVDRFRELLDLVPDGRARGGRRRGGAAARRCATTGRTSPRASTTRTPTTSTSTRSGSRERSTRRAALRLSSISGDQPHEFRAQSADTAARSLREAEPELEKLVRSGYRTVVDLGAARRGRARRSYNLARVQAAFLDGEPAPDRADACCSPHAGLREGFLAPAAEARDRARAPAAAPPPRRAPRGPAHAARSPSFTDLRAGDAVVHEDHGIARFTGFETKTVGGITRDYLELEYRDGDRVFVPSDQLAQDQPLRRRRRRRPAALEARRQAVGAAEAARPPRRRGARRRADQRSTPSASAAPATPSRTTPSGSSSSRARSPTARRPTSSRRSSGARPTWRRRARWTA